MRLRDIHRERVDRDALVTLARRLVATSDDVLSAIGYQLAGDLALEDGDLDRAKREYDAALERHEHRHVVRAARAALHAQMGHLDAALADLAALAPRQRAPELAVKGLEALRTRFPEDPRILRWLGFAQFEHGDLAVAEATFASYLTEVADDAEARRWLGLSLISVIPGNGDEERRDEGLFLKGMDELAYAAAGGDAEARDALIWLVDRLLVGKFYHAVGFSRPVGAALPSLHPMLDIFARSHEFTLRRDFVSALAALRECLSAAERLGLQCFVTHQHTQLAEYELLEGNLQAAAEHARKAYELVFIAGAPRSPQRLDQFEARARNTSPGTPPTAVMETEHWPIHVLMIPAFDEVRRNLARVLARAGDQKGALDALGDPAQLLAQAEYLLPNTAGISAEILRDIGRFDDALILLDRAEKNAKTDWERSFLLLARANVLGRAGRSEEAIQAFQAAEPMLDAEGRWVSRFNLAAYLDAAGLPTDALQILDEVDIAREARTDEDLFSYAHLRASVLAKTGRYNEAHEAVACAIAIAEELRSRLKDPALREPWTAKQEAAYTLAVRIAANNGN